MKNLDEQLSFDCSADFSAMFRAQPDLLVPEEAARMLCVTTRTLARKRQAGEIPFIEISKNRYRYLKKDIISLINARYKFNYYEN